MGQTFETMNNTVDRFFEPLIEHLGKILFWDPFAALGLDLGAKVSSYFDPSSAAAAFFAFATSV